MLNRIYSRAESGAESAALSKEGATALLPILSKISNDVKSLHRILGALSMERAAKALINLLLETETARVLHRVQTNIQLLVFAQTLPVTTLT